MAELIQGGSGSEKIRIRAAKPQHGFNDSIQTDDNFNCENNACQWQWQWQRRCRRYDLEFGLMRLCAWLNQTEQNSVGLAVGTLKGDSGIS
ncbi:hypothetical protein SUGI_0743140 [Cryptomeria japonica]|nr:hypothetical protein SUGI_0743140 [Cryptomeria japonica]